MLGRDRSQFDLLSALGGAEDMVVSTGLEGLAAFADSVGGWHAREDAGFLASYGSQVIEKFGTGGGNFRKMYSAFLRWARDRRPDLVPERALGLCDRSSAGWTEIAAALEQASKDPAEKSHWAIAAEKAGEILGIEKALFEALAEKSGVA
jgi:hypothetical protein